MFMLKFLCMYKSACMLNVRLVVCLLIYIVCVCVWFHCKLCICSYKEMFMWFSVSMFVYTYRVVLD